jgi:hypothetical protein
LKLAPNAKTGVGLVLHGCEPGSQAEVAGVVQDDDIITHINGTVRVFRQKFTLEGAIGSQRLLASLLA